MKVGELSKQTGISVKTLHHYDEMNLLNPSLRSDSGHRVYSQKDLLRLQKILTLKELGISLGEIKEILGLTPPKVTGVFDQQFEALEQEKENIERKLRLLKGAIQYMDLQSGAEMDELISMLRQFSLHEKYFSKEQLKELEAREEELGMDAIKGAMQEWPKLIAEATQAMERGTDFKDKRVLKIAKRWLELKDMFTNGNPELEASAQKMYSENSEVYERNKIDPGLFEYIGKAIKHIQANDLN